jgi:hypothetical protein
MRKKKKRVDETESKALERALLSKNIQPSFLTDFIFKNFELICQGTYFREGNEIFLVPFEVSLFKRNSDLLIEFKRFGITAYLAKLHKTKEKNIYRFCYKDTEFEIDFSNEITAVINKLHNILTVCNLLPVERDEFFRYLESMGVVNEREINY